MKVRKGVLKARRAILLAGSVCAVALPLCGAMAADLAIIYPSPPDLGWYYYGGFEAGARFYIQKPPNGFGRAAPPDNWLTPKNSESIAKFEEYGKIPQAPLLDWINLQAGSNDGRYALDFWGRSVGLNNQSYTLDAAAIGYHYLSLGWEQTPHLISTSAKNIFGGVGTTRLTVPDAVQAALQAQAPFTNLNSPAGAAARAATENIINANLSPLELSTQRDTSTVGYKYTPNDDWTFQVDYSHEHRTGVRPLGVSWGFATGTNGIGNGALGPFASNSIEAAAPINDTTQNVNAGGEYFGTTFFGTKWNTNVRYVGSFYDNHNSSFTVENPFCVTCTDTVPSNKVGPNLLFMPMPPDTQANGIVWNTGIDLPWVKGRYVSTFQYNHMTQNDPFPSTATNGVVPSPIRTLTGVPVSSLNGVVNTTLWNNVLTAHLTPELRLVAKARHYDVDNNTPMLLTTDYNRADSGLVATTRLSLPIAYTKDNASAELNYRPMRWLNVGGGWAWERWDRKFRDANVTKENMGKAYADATLATGVLWRGSYLYGQRRYDIYDTEFFVCDASGVGLTACSDVASNMRRFDVANRNRHKAETALEFAIIPANTTITPNAGLRQDEYPDPVFNPMGVRSDRAWNSGVEVSTLIQPTIKVTAAYTYEDRKLFVVGGTGGANFNSGSVLTGCSTNLAINPDAIIGTACSWASDIHQRSNTFLVATDWKVVPSVFDLRFEFLYTRSREENHTVPCLVPGTAGTSCNGLVTGVDPSSLNFGQFPDEVNTLKRFNVIGRYYVDPIVVRQMGWVGDVTLKVRYTWEHNHSSNWASDNTTPYVSTADPGQPDISGGARSLFLAAFNPNYNVHLIAATVGMKW